MNGKQHFNPVNKNPEVLGTFDANHFEMTNDGVYLSPDEAWVLKHFTVGIGDDSPYKNLHDYLADFFVSGVYERDEAICIPNEMKKELAGIYTGIYWEFELNDEDKFVVRNKIFSLIEHESDEIQTFFKKILVSPPRENSQN